MRIGPRLEATRHLLGKLALTLAREPRHHFPKQDRGTPTGLGCRRSKPLLTLASKPTKLLVGHHKQSICRQRHRHGLGFEQPHTQRKRDSRDEVRTWTRC